MERRHRFAVGVLALGLCLLTRPPVAAQGSNDPLARVPQLLKTLQKGGFEVLEGQFLILNPIPKACQNTWLPSAFYNNVQPYLTINLPADWEKTGRTLPPTYLLRQDEAIVIVGTTPPPMAYFSFQTFLFTRYNPASSGWDPATGGFYAPHELLFAYLGDTVNNLTVRTTGPTPFNRPMAFISTGNRKTQERIRGALRAAGYPDGIVNTETLPSSLVRFGYDQTADQFLYLFRAAIAAGGDAAMTEFKQAMVAGTVMRVFRVRPKTEFPADPLPAPVLRTHGTGQTEMDLFPTMEKLRQAVLDQNASGYSPEELDTYVLGTLPEGYPAIQRDVAYMGPSYEGSLGYGRDARYLVSPWFDLGEDDFALIYGVDHAATGKASYSSASVYLDDKLWAGISSADSGDFAAHPGTASAYLPGEPGIDKFFVWKVARNCHGDPTCVEASLEYRHKDDYPECNGTVPPAIGPDAPIRLAFRAYAEPATRVGPADAELLYERVIVFRKK